MWQKLINILLSLEGSYATLFLLNIKKRTAILNIDMHALDSIVYEEQESINKIAAIERTRQILLKKMAQENTLINPLSNSKTMTMLCPSKYKKQFLTANEKLSIAIKKASEINEANQLLIRGALTAVNMNINALVQMKADPNYKKNGNQSFSPQNKNLDFKI